MKIARKYQQECIDTVFTELHAGINKQLIVMATGMGKSFTFTKILSQFNRILVMSHTEELINQNAIAILREEEFCNQTLLDHLDGDVIGTNNNSEDLFENHGVDAETLARFKAHIGVIKQTRFDIDAKIVVASPQTLHRRLDRIPSDYFDCIVVDEVDLFLSKTFVKCINHFTPKLLSGWTATPERLDGQSLLNVFDKIVFDRDIKYGIDNGYLCELDAVRIKTDLSLDTVRTKAGEFNESDLEQIVDTPKRNKLIVESWKKYAVGRKTLLACVSVQHAMNIAQKFNNAGIAATFVCADTSLCPDRKERISLWRTGEITIMAHVNILTAGVDIPEISCVGMIRPTKSKRIWLQNIGRGTRLKQGQFKDCLILDFVDATSRHKLINAWELDKEKPVEERTFVSKEKKDALLFKMAEARKAKLDKENLHKRDKKVNLFKVPKMKVITSERMKEPATEAQLNWIAKWGYDIVNNEYTKAMCSEIISNQEASDKQKKWLSWKGYDVQGTLTIGEFQAAVTEIETREKAATTPKVAVPTPSYLPFKDLK